MVRVNVAAASVLVLVSFAVGASALPRIQILSSASDAVVEPSASLIDVDDIVVPDPVQYKNPKPLIGILSQACHYCPGK